MARDDTTNDILSHDAHAPFTAEEEPFISENDLAATEPQRRDARTRLLHALSPQLSEWLQASTVPREATLPTTTTHRRVPVTLRVAPQRPSINIDEGDNENDTEPVPPTISPTGSPRSTTSSDDGSQPEDMSTLDEFQTLFRRCHHTLPFVALFLLYFVYQHVVGIAVFAIGSVAIAGLDERLRAQIALKEQAKRLYLVGIMAICIVDTVVISSIDGEPNPFKRLTFKLQADGPDSAAATSHGAIILELLWIVLVNDFIVRFWSMAIKAFVAVIGASPRTCSATSPSGDSPLSQDHIVDEASRRKHTRSNVAFFRRKRKLYGIIELTSIFFRSLLAGLPWCSYYQLCESKFMADVFTFFYVFGKSVILGSQGRRLVKLIRSFLTLGLEHATYVSREELAEAGAPDCSICYETMQTPVKLSCSHLFCEECVMEWFDRERSCPLCRAAIVSTAQADGEPKPQFLDGSTSLFPQLF